MFFRKSKLLRYIYLLEICSLLKLITCVSFQKIPQQVFYLLISILCLAVDKCKLLYLQSFTFDNVHTTHSSISLINFERCFSCFMLNNFYSFIFQASSIFDVIYLTQYNLKTVFMSVEGCNSESRHIILVIN